MHLDPKSTIAGRPALEIRTLLRKMGDSSWSLAEFTAVFHAPSRRVKRLVDALCHLGYLAADPRFQKPGCWRATVQGNALANASAAPQLRRATADKMLQDFLRRVEAVNRHPEFAYRISKVAVFGSYLSSADYVSDLDVAIQLVFRETDSSRQYGLMHARIDLALARGRRFQNLVEREFWPRTEVIRFLKARVRGLSLHELEVESRLLKKVRIVFEE